MVFNYTDKQLNELNHGKNVYSVNDGYANHDENQTYTIVNGEPDYKNVAVIAAGTDPESSTKTDRCKTPFSYYSVI